MKISQIQSNSVSLAHEYFMNGNTKNQSNFIKLKKRTTEMETLTQTYRKRISIKGGFSDFWTTAINQYKMIEVFWHDASILMQRILSYLFIVNNNKSPKRFDTKNYWAKNQTNSK